MLHRLRLRARALFLRDRVEREMQREIAEHLDQSIARLVARGLSIDEARREARREFGNVAYLQEQARDARGAGWIDSLRADCRFALRHFGRRLGTTVTMLVVLVGGMSISTLLFTFVRAYAFAPPAGMGLEDDLVRIRGSGAAGGGGERIIRTFREQELGEYRKLTDQFRMLTGWTDAFVTVALGAGAEHGGIEARASFVVGSYFSVFGIRPQLGPGLPASESAAPDPVAVIGDGAWERLFARSPSAIGSTILVNGVSITVVGVAPPKFVGTPNYDGVQVWLPVSARRLVLSDLSPTFRVAGRLRPGTTAQAASAAVEAVARRSAETLADANVIDPSADVVSLLSANNDPMFERDVKLMSAGVGLLGLLVLLVACTNVSGLLTGLATSRQQEIAVRLSLGAARARLVRQLLTESALLAVMAGAGVVGVVWLILQLVHVFGPALPFEIGIAWPEATFTFAVAVAIGVLFGLSPALHATRLGVAAALRDAADTIAAGRGRLQRALVVAQIALTQPLIVLLVTVLLFVIEQAKPRPRNAIADRLVGISVRYRAAFDGTTPSADRTRRARENVGRLVETLDRTAGIEGAVINWEMRPLEGPYVVHRDDHVPARTPDAVELEAWPAASNHFDVTGMKFVRGRTFEAGEVSPPEANPAQLSAIIGASLAQRLWGDADAIGRRLTAATDSMIGARTLVVVGVIDDSNDRPRKPTDEHRIYVPPDTTLAPASVTVRTSALGQTLVPALRETVQAIAPDMSVQIRVLGEIADEYTRTYWTITAALSVAGLASLLLSAIGLYAVVALSVGQRTREIAVRMAVGARGGQIVQRFVNTGLRLSAVGLALGLPISIIGLSFLMDVLDDDIPRVALGPVTTIAALGVLLVALAAAWIPARRAASVAPAEALRST
jgi:predicted permease